ncbi:PLDc N-terminal domain-containing protein [Myxococcota bacterium]|nr:PLDc N-terminal domain-containing protein [Myxococcota bacterium]
MDRLQIIIALAAWTAGMIGVSVHILLNKKNPIRSAIWLLLVWFIPVGGFLLYWAFGDNRIARRAKRRLKARRPDGRPDSSGRVPPALIPLQVAGDRIAHNPLMPGNSIEMLENGDEVYPAMLAAIASSRKSVALLSYIFDGDEICRHFTDALCEAARRGVEVRLLVDGIGARGYGPVLRRRLTEAGGRMASFWRRGRWLRHPGLNLRNHRKILIVDGETGFTGGINISARHVTAPGEDYPRSFDAHFKLRGPVVGHLMETFTDDWELSAGETLSGPLWFPELSPAGNVLARGIASGPDFSVGRLHDLLLAALRTARTSIDLMSPYFIPDEAIMAGIRTAARSGVRVRLFIPAKADHHFMSWGARAYLPELTICGVEVWEMGPGFNHSKLTVIDDEWIMMGSSNLDPRSFRLNFEFNVEAYSRMAALDISTYIERQIAGARRIDTDTLKKEPRLIQLRNKMVALLSPFL